MNVHFKKGVLELCVLVLVSKKDRYGYELAKGISKRMDVAEGTVYPLLRRLTKEKCFTTYLTESTEGPTRKYYAITEHGTTYKQRLLSEWSQFIDQVNQLIKEDSHDE